MQRQADRERERLRASGRLVSGTVKEVWWESRRGYYNVTYSFMPAGAETVVERTETVYRDDWRRPAVGDSVDIVYDPLAPNYSALSSPETAGAVVRVSPEQVTLAANLDADEAWIEAYRALPQQQQSRRREEFRRRLLDYSERLLTASSVPGNERDGHLLRAVRRTKQLLASGMSFNDAAAMALDEMEQRFQSPTAGQKY